MAQLPALEDLEDACSTHAAADAHGDTHALGAAAFALDQGVAGQALAGHAIGMADGDAPPFTFNRSLGMPSLSRQ